MSGCELCDSMGGELVWEDEQCRVVYLGGAEGAEYPGFCRVVWRGHVREMTDLPAVERRHLMNVVFATEVAVRALCRPDKTNLASLGNVTPHLHWHVIPRWTDDCNFPAPIWTAAQRASSPPGRHPSVPIQSLHERINTALAESQGGSA